MAQYTTKSPAVALVAATAKTVLELTAGSADQVKIKEWWAEFDGTNAAAVPVLVEVVRKTATVTGTAVTPLKKDPADGAAAASAKHNATAEGTDGDVLYRHNVHPQGGKHVLCPLGDEIVVPLSGIIAIKCTAPAGVNVVVGFTHDE